MEIDKAFLVQVQDLIEILMESADDHYRGRYFDKIVSDGDADPVYLRLCEFINEAKN